MVRRFRFGKPVKTDAVPVLPEGSKEALPYFTRSADGKTYEIAFEKGEKIFGLGEQIRGMNKRGWSYTSFCADNPHHEETTHSLYGAHNFLIFARKKPFGVFFDYPGKITFDIGWTDPDICTVTAVSADMNIYIIESESLTGIVTEFRKLIGRSYIPPRFAFGYQQSRWGYKTAEDIRGVINAFKEKQLPLDSVCMDIDYMEDFKDFTVNSERFPNFPEFVKEVKAQNIHLIPIIDAGVKIEDGYDIYEEGIKNGYFCKKADGKEFVAGVWPGRTHFPDFLNSKVRAWFGDKYKKLTDLGIDGFWNDMNEPAIFYSDEGLEKAKMLITGALSGNLAMNDFFTLSNLGAAVSNSDDDYAAFYHEQDEDGETRTLRHDLVHNLYGYNMTRAAFEGFERNCPDRRILMYSRASYIGSHRYGGIWTGDNASWWSHLLLNIKMMPSLSMCGYLYSGADLGGFGADSGPDLVLRWLQFGVFTPLMRNHSALGTKLQEPIRFGMTDAFCRTMQLRYRLLGYIYSEFMKAALEDKMLFRPLCFDYPDDDFAPEVEDQLMFGESLMLTPIYEQNAAGRNVYLPEDMLLVKFISEEAAENAEGVRRLRDGAPVILKQYEAGRHYIDVALDEIPMFLRPDTLLPLLDPAPCEAKLNYSDPELLAYHHSRKAIPYKYYTDDGVSRDYNNTENFNILIHTNGATF